MKLDLKLEASVNVIKTLKNLKSLFLVWFVLFTDFIVNGYLMDKALVDEL